MDRFQDRYRIPSVRFVNHDYSGGVYHITICTKNRECAFGEITWVEEQPLSVSETQNFASLREKRITLSVLGKYLDDCIMNITSHCPYAEIPVWQVMPNHVHLVVVIDETKVPYERRRLSDDLVETQNFASQKVGYRKTMRQTEAEAGWLSVAIRSLKRAVTAYANQNHIPFAWQERFYDRIIRDQGELNRTVQYIEENVANWKGEFDDDM